VLSVVQIPSTFSDSCESLISTETSETSSKPAAAKRERWWWKLRGRRKFDMSKTASIGTDEEQSELESCIDDDDSGFVNATPYKRLQESQASLISAELIAGQELDKVKKQQDRRRRTKFTKSTTFSITKLVGRAKTSNLPVEQDDLLAGGDAATLEELKPKSSGSSAITPLLAKEDQACAASKCHQTSPKRSWKLPRLQLKKTKSRVTYESPEQSCESVLEEGQLVGGSELQTNDVRL